MSQLIPAITGLAPIAAGVGLIALFGRDPKADEHDLSDYHEPSDAFATDWTPQMPSIPAVPVEGTPEPTPWREVDILPPAPPGTNAGGSPIHAALIAEQIVAEQLREQYGTTNPDAIAGTILRQLATKQVTR